MSIAVKCEGCGRVLNVKDEYLGKMLKCPQCGVKFTAAVPEQPDQSQKIIDKISSQWPAVTGTVGIVCGLAIVILTRNSEASRYTSRLGFAVMGLGLASLGYWALSSSNKDYNF